MLGDGELSGTRRMVSIVVKDRMRSSLYVCMRSLTRVMRRLLTPVISIVLPVNVSWSPMRGSRPSRSRMKAPTSICSSPYAPQAKTVEALQGMYVRQRPMRFLL